MISALIIFLVPWKLCIRSWRCYSKMHHLSSLIFNGLEFIFCLFIVVLCSCRISTPTYLSAGYYASVLRIFNATLETRGLYTCQASDFNSYLQQCKCLEVFVLAEWTGHVELKKEVVEKVSLHLVLYLWLILMDWWTGAKNRASQDVLHDGRVKCFVIWLPH